MKSHTLIVRLITSKGSEWSSPNARKRFWSLMYQAGYTNSEYASNEIDSFSRKYGVQFFDVEMEDITQQRVMTSDFQTMLSNQQDTIIEKMSLLKQVIDSKKFKFVTFDGFEVYFYFMDYIETGRVDFSRNLEVSNPYQFGELDPLGDSRVFVLPSVVRSSDNYWKSTNGKERWKKFWLKLKHYYPIKRSNLWAVIGIFIITALLLFIILSKK
ncbi:MAG: hypothetical protein RL362_932 [Bacteroidota bacterium]